MHLKQLSSRAFFFLMGDHLERGVLGMFSLSAGEWTTLAHGIIACTANTQLERRMGACCNIRTLTL